MSLLDTAIRHFNEDINRARSLLDHARTIGDIPLRRDVARSAWMMAVGALDAYFCDAYGDIVARTLRAKHYEPSIPISRNLHSLKIPATVFIENRRNGGWLWRMVARDLIERDSVLSIHRIRELFNPFMRDTHKLLVANGPVLESWILHGESKTRLFGFSSTHYRRQVSSAKNNLKKQALAHLSERFIKIFQRRHDCIHNCDRPKTKIKNTQITPEYTGKILEDVSFLVNRCHEGILSEFPIYIRNLGFGSVTRNKIGA